MTKLELAEFLGYKSGAQVFTAFQKAIAEAPGSFKKSYKGNPYVVTNFSKEECLVICKYMGYSELELEVIKEKLPEDEKKRFIRKDSPYIKGTEEFIEAVNKRSAKKACGNCAYCVGRVMANTHTQRKPYCNFYRKFLSKMWTTKYGKKVKVDIFNDWCETWSRSEPKLFYRRINKRIIAEESIND